MTAALACTDSRLIEGIQFRVLAQVFPVLRHDALKPLSNAKLTTVLLEKAITKGTIIAPDAPPFVSDLDTMLDESVEAIRLLNNWFQDEGERVDAHSVFVECRKLAFSQLLLSGKRIEIDAFTHRVPLQHRTSRYVVMAWLIHAIQSLPERGVLRISQDGPTRVGAAALPAPADERSREPRPDTSAPFLATEVDALAQCYGWKVLREGDRWTLQLPSAEN